MDVVREGRRGEGGALEAAVTEQIALALVQKCRSRAWGEAAVERYGATPSSAGRPMPYKFNEPRRHKIPRARYRVQNWPEYDRALQRRGDLTVWVTPEAIAAWCPPRTGRRGRPRDYSDVAIETGHLLRLAFGHPWRQTEGLLAPLRHRAARPGGWRA